MAQTQIGAEFVATGMSDNMIVGGGARVTVGADLWLCALAGMEEKIGTAVFDGALVELFATAFEREYGPGLHAAGAVSFSGSVHATTAAGFRPLFKVMCGVRNQTPGGGGGGGAEGPPPAPPPAGPGAAAGGLVATADTADTGAGLARAVDTGDDLDDITQLAALAQRTDALEDSTGVEDLANTLEDAQAVARGGDDVDEGADAGRRYRPVELASESEAAAFQDRRSAYRAADKSHGWIEPPGRRAGQGNQEPEGAEKTPSGKKGRAGGGSRRRYRRYRRYRGRYRGRRDHHRPRCRHAG